MTSNQSESTTRSGKYFRTNREGDRSIYNPLRESVVHAGTSPPATPPSSQHKGKNSPTPLPPLEEDMAAHMKLPTFNGIGDEDMDRFWFIAESVWTAQNLASDVVKSAQLSLSFQGRALDWFMGNIVQHVDPSIKEIKDDLKQQF